MTIITCPDCSAPLAPARILRDFNRLERFYCTRNPEHIWKADGQRAGWTLADRVPSPLP